MPARPDPGLPTSHPVAPVHRPRTACGHRSRGLGTRGPSSPAGPGMLPTAPASLDRAHIPVGTPEPRPAGDVRCHPQSTALTTFTRHVHLPLRDQRRSHPKGQASVKFRSERDALVDMLATAGRAVGGRGGSSPVLLGLLLTCTGNSLTRDRDRPGPDHPGDRRGHRDRRRQLCRSGPPLDRHRAAARARRGDLRRRRGRTSHHLGAARPSSCTPIRSWSSRRWARPASPDDALSGPVLWLRRCARSCAPRRTTTAGRC